MERTPPGPSPKILSIAWGRMEVEGLAAGKDFMLYPGGGRAWDWRETGTQHSPGILPPDVRELLDRSAKAIVLSRGMEGRLGIAPETSELLRSLGVPVHSALTDEAVRRYNELAEDAAVGGLFHSTC